MWKMRKMRKKNNFYPASLLTQQGTKKPKTSKMKKVAFFGTVMLLAVIMARLTVLGKFDRIFPVPENLVVLGWKQIQVQPGNTVWGFAKKYNNIDTRLVVYLIQGKNNIGASIHAGEIILIPSAVKYRWDNKISFPKKL